MRCKLSAVIVFLSCLPTAAISVGLGQAPGGGIQAQNSAGERAQASAQAPSENVTVTGSRRMYHDFSRNFATPTKSTGKIARWERRICPIVAGQDSHAAAFIAQHLKYVALAAGAPVNTEADCMPNIHIIFTTTPQDLLNSVAKDNQH